MREKKRLVMISIGIFFLFSLLIVQYFKIQILEGDKWTKHALSQHEIVVTEPFRRGTFFSNTSVKKGNPEPPQPLVFDVTKYHLYIDPQSIPEAHREGLADQLITMTGISEEKRAEFQRKSRSRRLAPWLDLEQKEAILAWWRPWARKRKIPRNALYFVTDYKRSYPYGKLLGQTLHTIRDRKDETTAEGFPTGGLEAYFNDFLKGELGKRKLLRSPLNHLEVDQVIKAPLDGADVYLTVNHCLQAIVEEELQKGVIAAGAKGGWAVMMDPSTGEILALAQVPFFHPEHYQDFFNDPEKIENAKVKAMTDAFELGSIMKPITLSIGYKGNEELARRGESPIFSEEEKMDVTRTRFPGRGSRPLKDPTFHKAMNMNMAIQKSSNVYMAQVVDRVIDRLGEAWYRKQLVETFGFSHKTGIELPGESSGLVPRIGKLHPNGALEWSTPTPYSLAIGYNMLATSLQMLRAYSVFASGGYLAEPTLVRKVVKNGKILLDQTSPKAFPQVLDPAVVAKIVTAMKFTTKPGGTGQRADVYGYSEAGKTGTAEKIVGGLYSKERYISSFIGFAPANTIPARFVLIVTIDEPKPIRLVGGLKNYVGGMCAAPVFREIAKRTLEYLGVAPDDHHGYPLGDPRYDPEKADWIKQVRDLKLLYEQWNRP